MQELVAAGCVVAPFSDTFEALQSFDDWFNQKLMSFVREEILKRPMKSYSKIIILDDGGFMHLVVNELCPNFTNIVGIEQTSSGHHRITKAGVHFPVISVARSYHKLHYESPYIARNGEQRLLDRIQRQGLKNPRVLVFGLGAIGRQIAGRLLLVEQFEGYVTDPNIERIRSGVGDVANRGVFDLLEKDHYLPHGELLQRIGDFNLLIGCTGSSVLHSSDIDALHPEAMLISMSSSDREFPSQAFRCQGGTVHQDYINVGRTLINAGFPITFDGKGHAMPPEQIELTISLLMIRLLQEVSDARLHLPSVVSQIHALWQPDTDSHMWSINT
jgi:S-adenosylhomocysteine hydrolase